MSYFSYIIIIGFILISFVTFQTKGSASGVLSGVRRCSAGRPSVAGVCRVSKRVNTGPLKGPKTGTTNNLNRRTKSHKSCSGRFFNDFLDLNNDFWMIFYVFGWDLKITLALD